jgi:rhamnosyltransferase subunit A
MQKSSDIVDAAGFATYVEQHGADPARPTVILVNGALATTTSFRQTTRYLGEFFNVVLYDLPYAGQSKKHNKDIGLVTKDDEVEILAALIERYQVNHVISMSWGGVAAVLALSRQPPSVRSAVVASFSPVMNEAMLDYVVRAKQALDAGQLSQGADLLNNTVGKFLPRLLKLYNYRFLVTLDEPEYVQINFHIQQILGLEIQRYLQQLARITVPVLFLNGEKDEYTSPADVRLLADPLKSSRFATIPDAGHFLELESRTAYEQVRQQVCGFLCPGLTVQASTPIELSLGST